MTIQNKLGFILALLYRGKQQGLATTLGVNRSTVSRWLSGAEISSNALAELYKKGISIDWLLNENDVSIMNMFAVNDSGRNLKESILKEYSKIKSASTTRNTSQMLNDIPLLKDLTTNTQLLNNMNPEFLFAMLHYIEVNLKVQNGKE